jgi:DNA polymerase-2
VAPNGARFRREQGILPRLLDELFPRREDARRRGDEVASQAIKILMNSFYGVLGTPACRFHDPEIANAITSFGREILLWTKRRIERDGNEVLYGDTDSLFVRPGLDDPGEARRHGERLVERVNADLARHVGRTWRVDSRLELEFERLYLRMIFLHARHGEGGARKRYAGLVESADGGTEVRFTGLEAVRRDWTDLARRVQRELYARLFRDRPVDDYLRDVVRAVREGRMDGSLVYRKTLRKRLADYEGSNPPHVVAARAMRGRPGRTVRYVVTVEGPRVADEPHAPLDHEHYVQRQIRPVAEPVLAVLGLEFDRAVGDDTQMRLF